MVYEFRDRAELDEYFRTAAGLLSVLSAAGASLLTNSQL
jgi:hypothetical protein